SFVFSTRVSRGSSFHLHQLHFYGDLMLCLPFLLAFTFCLTVNGFLLYTLALSKKITSTLFVPFLVLPFAITMKSFFTSILVFSLLFLTKAACISSILSIVVQEQWQIT